MAEQDLRIRIQQILEGGNALKETNKDLKDTKDALFALQKAGQSHSDTAKQLEQRYTTLNKSVLDHKNHLKDLSGTHSTVAAGVEKMSQAMEAFQAIIEVLAVAELVKKIGELSKQVYEFGLQGAEFSEMKQHFDDMNGGIELATQKMQLLRDASAGNLNDKAILDYVNRLDELNYTTTQSTQILDIATTKHHELGISIEDATSKITRFIETGNKKGLQTLGISYSEVIERSKDLVKQSGQVYEKLDEESKRTARLNAVMELYGKSLDDIKNKEKTEADVIKSISTDYDNAILKLKQFVGEAIVPVINGIKQYIGAIKEMAIQLLGGIDGIEKMKSQFLSMVSAIVSQVVPALIEVAKNAFKIYQAVKDLVDQNPQLIDILKVMAKVALTVFEGVAGTIASVFAWLVEQVNAAIGLAKDGLLIVLQTARVVNEALGNDTSGLDNAIEYLNGVKGANKVAQGNHTAQGYHFPSDNTSTEYNSKDSGKSKTKDEIDQIELFLSKLKEQTTEIENEYQLGNLTLKQYKDKYEIIRKLLEDNKTLFETGSDELEKQKNINKYKTELVGINKKIVGTEKEITDQVKAQKDLLKAIDDLSKPKQKAPKDATDGGGSNKRNPLTRSDKEEAAKAGITETEAWEGLMAGLSTVTSKVQGLFSMLGAGTDSFIGKMLGGFGQVLSIIDSVVAIVKTMQAIGGFLSILGLEEGGYTPKIGTSTPAGIVHGGEYVMPNWMSPLFPIMESIRTSQGGNVSNLAYASGGFVRPNQNPNITVFVQSEVEQTKAVKFLKNYTPLYNIRNSGSNI